MCAGDLQAVLVNNPKVAAAVAEICMVGLATTAHATRGPPKPDKARIDRLAYVVSELHSFFFSSTLQYLSTHADNNLCASQPMQTINCALNTCTLVCCKL